MSTAFGKSQQSCLDIVTAAHGMGLPSTVPDWALALANACDAQGRAAVARRLGYSESVLSQMLSNNYGGNVEKVSAKIRAVIMAEMMTCPAEGPMALDMCQRHQARRESDIQNGWHRRMFAACRSGCPHFEGSKG
jgi:DNA-binding transcriptional regulator YdaS (Cro superfamily)